MKESKCLYCGKTADYEEQRLISCISDDSTRNVVVFCRNCHEQLVVLLQAY